MAEVLAKRYDTERVAWVASEIRRNRVELASGTFEAAGTPVERHPERLELRGVTAPVAADGDWRLTVPNASVTGALEIRFRRTPEGTWQWGVPVGGTVPDDKWKSAGVRITPDKVGAKGDAGLGAVAAANRELERLDKKEVSYYVITFGGSDTFHVRLQGDTWQYVRARADGTLLGAWKPITDEAGLLNASVLLVLRKAQRRFTTAPDDFAAERAEVDREKALAAPRARTRAHD
jgi:hypothetical protein